MPTRARDVTATMSLGEDAEHRAQLLDSALGAVDDQVFVLDRCGRNVYANLAGAAAVGLGRSELVGRTWAELGTAPQAVVEAFETLLESVFRTGRRRAAVYQVPSPAGLRDYRVTLTPVFGDDGTTVEHVIDVVTDITPTHDVADRHATEISLTERQRQIIELVARGYANREIAERLVISVRTVETHRRDIAKRTGLRTRSQVFAYARDCRLI